MKNCIQDSMAQNNGFMPIKSPQKQPKRSLRRSKTPPRSPYDFPRRPKTPPRRPQGAPKRGQEASKTPPRRLQDASKKVQDASKDALDRPRRPKRPPNLPRSPPDLDFGRFLIDFWSIFNYFLVDFWSIFHWFFIPFQGSKNKRFNIKKTKNQSAVAGTQLCCALDNWTIPLILGFWPKQ